ncbi:MAG: hypothetical protein CMG07_01570 [Candidatus Marinimicrobia bacterium]|nr:hypothetical protein [Candidatus Neomarinimicrobiota bacterium]
MMKKFWCVLLICFLSTAFFGDLLHHCLSCTSGQFTHCIQTVSQNQNNPSCHTAAAVEKKTCCPSDNQAATDDCQVCSSHDQPAASEKIVDTHIKSKFHFENVVAQVNPFSNIAPPEKNITKFKLRRFPLMSSVTFLKTIRLLC